jgi:hypothetical protein
VPISLFSTQSSAKITDASEKTENQGEVSQWGEPSGFDRT